MGATIAKYVLLVVLVAVALAATYEVHVGGADEVGSYDFTTVDSVPQP